jgi:predicted RNase H-like nuclease (RuvC/YqgF family)
MDKKLVITALYNEKKPITYEQSLFKEKDGGMYMNFTESIITQMVKARDEDMFKAICERIQEFIEREGIDVCFAINQNELLDCLDEHKKLKLQITDLETKLAESENTIRLLKMSNDALREDNLDLSYNQVDNVYETATEMSKGWESQYQEEIAQLKQQLAEKEKEVKDVKDTLMRLLKICGNSNCHYKTQTAIAELEKVKEKVLQETNRVEEIYSDGLQSGFNCCYVFTREIINQQIAELKGDADV